MRQIVVGITLLVLVACAPTVEAPLDRTYSTDVGTAVSAIAEAIQSLGPSGYGPYAIEQLDRDNGFVRATWAGTFGSSRTLTATVTPIGEAGVRVVITGTSSSLANDTGVTVARVYELLDERFTRLPADQP